MPRYADIDTVRDALYEADAITMKGVRILNQFPTISPDEVRGVGELPCKTDTIWIVEEATHDCDTVPDKDCMARPNCKGCPALKSYVRRIDTFYFTRAEAEKAMEVSEDA